MANPKLYLSRQYESFHPGRNTTSSVSLLRVVVPLIRVADQKGKEHDELNVACNSGKEALLHLPHIQMMLCRR